MSETRGKTLVWRRASILITEMETFCWKSVQTVRTTLGPSETLWDPDTRIHQVGRNFHFLKTANHDPRGSHNYRCCAVTNDKWLNIPSRSEHLGRSGLSPNYGKIGKPWGCFMVYHIELQQTWTWTCKLFAEWTEFMTENKLPITGAPRFWSTLKQIWSSKYKPFLTLLLESSYTLLHSWTIDLDNSLETCSWLWKRTFWYA